jgi:hypothetical protein
MNGLYCIEASVGIYESTRLGGQNSLVHILETGQRTPTLIPRTGSVDWEYT